MNAQLHAAIAAREVAHAKVEAASSTQSRARQTDEEAQAELSRREHEHREWISRQSAKLDQWNESGGHGSRPTLAADAKAVLALQSARDNAEAAALSRQRADAAVAAARQELQAAEATVLEAARAALFAEVRADFERFRRQAAELSALREGLFAAYLGGGRGALKPVEWDDLDHAIGSPSALMDIGLGAFDVPLNRLEQTGERDRPREARARIDARLGEFQQRLGELQAGESTAPLEAGEAAA